MTAQVCLRCGITPTWNQFWALKPDCDGENHLLLPGQMPNVLCPECLTICPDDEKVASGGKCGPCSYAEEPVEDEERFSYA